MQQLSIKQERLKGINPPHKIGPTGQVNLEGRTFEVELNIHHKGKTYSECLMDCPKGWEIPVYELLQRMRNNPDYRNQFNLLDTLEFVQNPDDISRVNGYVAWFNADSGRARLGCVKGSDDCDASLGVRYVREISTAEPSS